MTDTKQHPASFRDPAGFVFAYEGKYYRQVNQRYAAAYTQLKNSGLYDELVKEKKLLSHTELEQNLTGSPDWYKTLLPEQLSFISQPWEWCFSQWKNAALLTLSIAKKAMEKGMMLKDATPFNIQFQGTRPVFIDTLSFEPYDAGKPWVAYRQFTECFLGPLLLARYRSQDMPALFQLHTQGIPPALVSRLLPFKTRFNLNIYLHVHLPARMAAKAGDNAPEKKIVFSEKKLFSILDSLDALVRSLELPASVTTWNNYYEETILGKAYVEEKKAVIGRWLQQSSPATVLDIGTNTGLFAELAAAKSNLVIAVDADIDCINRLYRHCREQKIKNILPLRIDITNPSPATGWDNAERSAFLHRAKADLTMALALIHHLAITYNVTFPQMAATFAATAPQLIIEFVPKSDPKTALLLQHRED
ncbi:MAG: class I SAM-dependent methyltransferase, partial [Bacteroidetes bacterium]|nr:class I SAM-dependent methyltransferase [Bacteroidota bacterium]